MLFSFINFIGILFDVLMNKLQHFESMVPNIFIQFLGIKCYNREVKSKL